MSKPYYHTAQFVMPSEIQFAFQGKLAALYAELHRMTLAVTEAGVDSSSTSDSGRTTLASTVDGEIKQETVVPLTKSQKRRRRVKRRNQVRRTNPLREIKVETAKKCLEAAELKLQNEKQRAVSDGEWYEVRRKNNRLTNIRISNSFNQNTISTKASVSNNSFATTPAVSAPTVSTLPGDQNVPAGFTIRRGFLEPLPVTPSSSAQRQVFVCERVRGLAQHKAGCRYNGGINKCDLFPMKAK